MNPEITKGELEAFAASANEFFGLSTSDQIDFFVYFLTIEKGLGTTQATNIRECFLKLDLTPYSNISQYLNNNLKPKDGSHPKFLRVKDAFQLHRSTKNTIGTQLDKKPLKAKVTKELNDLLTHVKNPNENEFLSEALSCFAIGAYRASIVMVWNLTVDHLYEYILKHELVNFNLALSKNTDKRIKITTILTKDDFSEIPEGKFLELCRAGNIISNDVRKILDLKLGTRNTYAHPSNVKMTESKAVEFIEDMVTNVVLKFRL